MVTVSSAKQIDVHGGTGIVGEGFEKILRKIAFKA
jgi:hypothetical protein